MTIWKYELAITDHQSISMPKGASILSIGNQDGNLCLWVMVDPTKEKHPIHIEIIGTGNPLPNYLDTECIFIGTVILNPFVWHVFQRLD